MHALRAADDIVAGWLSIVGTAPAVGVANTALRRALLFHALRVPELVGSAHADPAAATVRLSITPAAFTPPHGSHPRPRSSVGHLGRRLRFGHAPPGEWTLPGSVGNRGFHAWFEGFNLRRSEQTSAEEGRTCRAKRRGRLMQLATLDRVNTIQERELAARVTTLQVGHVLRRLSRLRRRLHRSVPTGLPRGNLERSMKRLATLERLPMCRKHIKRVGCLLTGHPVELKHGRSTACQELEFPFGALHVDERLV